MKKLTAISAVAAAVLALSAGSAFAQSGVQASSSASVDVGGLGTGLTHMVKDILGDTDAAPAPVLSPSAAMMQSTGVQLKAAPAPAARSAKIAPQAQVFSATTLSTSATTAEQTDADVSAFIGHLLQSDQHIRSVDASDSHVRVTYVTAVRIFGLIRVDMPVTGEAYASGSTDVTYPWYGSIGGIRSDIKSRFDARIAPETNAEGIAPEARIAIIGDMQAFFADEFSAK